MLCQNKRQNRIQLITIGMFAQLEDVKRIAIHLIQLFLSFRAQIEKSVEHDSSQFRTQLCEDCLWLRLLVLEEHRVVFESSLLPLLSELGIPGFHALLQMNGVTDTVSTIMGMISHSWSISIFIASLRVAVLKWTKLFFWPFKILLVQLIRWDHFDAVLECYIRPHVMVDSLLNLAQFLDDLLLYGD